MADQPFKAKVVQGEETVDYTPGGALAAGAPVVIGGIVGIARLPIAAGAAGAIDVDECIYDGAKDASVFAAGAPVFWAAAGSPVGGTGGSGAFTSGAGVFFGWSTAAALTGDATVRFRLTQAIGGGGIPVTIADPGASGAIPVTASGYVPLVSAAPETRTLAAPAFVGEELLLVMKTDGGDITLTCATTLNQAGNNTAVFNDVGDTLRLVAVQSGANIRWRIDLNDTVALSTV